MNKRKVGAGFEKLAAEFLESKGYQILAMNFRRRQGEIDIIARDGEYIVFCEVKYRTGSGTGHPFEAVNYYKQRSIIGTAKYFLYKYHYPEDTPCRFDVIGFIDGRIEHQKDAFWA